MSLARVALPLLAALLLARPAAAQPGQPLVLAGKLTKDDPFDRFMKRSHHKAHEVQFDKGRPYVIDLEADLFDPLMRVEDPGGKVLAHNDDIGVEDLNARLVFVPPEAGKYRVLVSSAAPGQTGAYRLGVYPSEQLEKPRDVAGKLTKESPKVADKRQEIHELPLKAGRYYFIRLSAEGFDARLYTLHGGRLVGLDGPRRQCLAQVLPEKDSVYRFLVSAANAGETGAYRLWVWTFAAPKELLTREAPLPAAPPDVVHGRLAKEDPPDRVNKQRPHKAHTVKLAGGQLYLVTLRSKDFNVALRLEDAQGKVLGVDEDPGVGHGGRVALVPAEAMTVRLVVTSAQAGRTGWYELQVARFAAAGALRRRPPAEQTAAGLVQEGRRLAQAGDYARAAASVRESLTARRQLYPPALFPDGHPELIESLDELAMVLADDGKLGAARPPLDEAVAMARKGLPAGHPLLRRCLSTLAATLRLGGRLDEARRSFEEVVALEGKHLPADHPNRAETLNNLGAVLQELGLLEEASRHHERALAIQRKALPDDRVALAHTLNNLGTLHHVQGDRDAARRRYEEALAIFEKAKHVPPADRATCLLNLGNVFREQGRPEAARGLYRRALAICQELPRGGHPLPGILMTSVGLSLRAEGKLDEALAQMRESVAVFEKALPADHPYLAMAQNNLALLLYRLDRADEGWRALAASARSRARHAAALAAGSGQADHLAVLRHRRWMTDALVSAARPGDDPARLRELFHAVLDARNVSGDLQARQQQRLLAGGDPAARADFERLLGWRRRLADLLLQGAGKRAPEQYRQECTELRAAVERLERDLAGRVEALGDWHKAVSASADELAARLGPGTALIEFIRYRHYHLKKGKDEEGERYAALLLCAGQGKAGPRVHFVPLGEAGPLEGAVRAWRRTVQKGQPDPAAAGALRRLLWEPLAAAVPEDTRRLVIAPDGELALLPFEALTLHDGKFLLERYAVSYVSSGRDLMPRPLPEERPQVALVLADPDYGAEPGKGAEQGAEDRWRAGLRFQSLPGFAREADAVAKLLTGRDGWQLRATRREHAAEEALLRVSRPRLLYCITHGFFLEDVKRVAAKDSLRDLEVTGARPRLPNFGEDPRLRSGLALAGANKWQERSAKGLSDGFLTALEVENLDLWGTELVVLSACDTGRGEVQVGEGVLGLRRAFQLAGAQTVLASLWKVPDAETEQLMTDTLSRWLKGAPPHEALREAQLEMIRRLRTSPEARRREAPPLYWAGFICHGQAR